MLLFSATYDRTVMKFAETVVPYPVTIRLRREEESLENIRQVFHTRHQHAEELVLISRLQVSVVVVADNIIVKILIIPLGFAD